MPRKRPDADPADPARLIAPAEFARLLGHADTSTLSAWVADKPGRPAPPDFPAPDAWDELPTRRRPRWRLDRAKAFVKANPPVAQRRTSNPRGRTGRRFTPRAVEVAAWLAAVDAGKREPVTRQEVEEHFDVSAQTARDTLASARAYREQS